MLLHKEAQGFESVFRPLGWLAFEVELGGGGMVLAKRSPSPAHAITQVVSGVSSFSVGVAFQPGFSVDPSPPPNFPPFSGESMCLTDMTSKTGDAVRNAAESASRRCTDHNFQCENR